jgi:UDPglucose 6-dehydrogenase
MGMSTMIERIGVVGLGMVGGAVSRAFQKAGTPVDGYDRYLGVGAPERLAGCRVVFLCVPTPNRPNGSFDLSEVWSAVREIEPVLPEGCVVAVKSTVAPGTIDRLASSFPRIEFAAVPEFLVATDPDETFATPDRLVIGTRSPEVATLLVELMAKVAPEAPALVVQPIEAELSKLCSNTLLAAKVAMANELSDVCDAYGVPWSRVKGVVGLDRRIGPDHLSVTRERGFGGACLPKDLDGLIAAASSAGHSPPLLDALASFNRRIRADSASAETSPQWISSNGNRGAHSRASDPGRNAPQARGVRR